MVHQLVVWVKKQALPVWFDGGVRYLSLPAHLPYTLKVRYMSKLLFRQLANVINESVAMFRASLRPRHPSCVSLHAGRLRARVYPPGTHLSREHAQAFLFFSFFPSFTRYHTRVRLVLPLFASSANCWLTRVYPAAPLFLFLPRSRRQAARTVHEEAEAGPRGGDVISRGSTRFRQKVDFIYCSGGGGGGSLVRR